MDFLPDFVPVDIDPTSGFPTLHLSYIMEILIPRRFVGPERIRDQVQKVFNGTQAIGKVDMKIVPVGSKAEGYNIPDAVFAGQGRIVFLSDVDIILANDKIQVCEDRAKMNDVVYMMHLDTNGVHPGYGTLQLIRKPKSDHFAVLYDEKMDAYYMSGTKYQTEFLNQVLEGSEEEREMYELHGPALQYQDNKPFTYDRRKEKIVNPFDHIHGFHCDDWPSVANEWTTRHRSNGWLSPELVQRIVSNGCYLVPVPHKRSKNPDVEWRISFAESEQMVAEYAVTNAQRQCFIFFKLLRYQIQQETSKKLLSSYCLKNVFLFCCEQLPVAAWDVNPGHCLLHMLDCVQTCLQQGELPNYFIPDNNLLDLFTDEDINTSIVLLDVMRSDVISLVLNFTDNHVLVYEGNGCLTTKVVFRSVIASVLEDVPTYIKTRNVVNSLTGAFLRTQCDIAVIRLRDGCSPFEYHKAFMDCFLSSHLHDIHIIDLFNLIGLNLGDIVASLKYFELLLQLQNVYPDVVKVKGNLACMYFTASQLLKSISGEQLGRADELFKEVLAHEGVHFPTTIDYSNYLCHAQKWREAGLILEQFVRFERKCHKCSNSYNSTESVTLDPVLQKEFAHTNLLHLSSLSLAYYYLIKAYTNLHLDFSDHLYDFDQHCASIQCAVDFQLLGYCYVNGKNYPNALKSFLKALEVDPSNDVAAQNVDFCEEKLAKEKIQNGSKWLSKGLVLVLRIVEMIVRNNLI